jgi:putative transposase
MMKSRFAPSQVEAILKQAESGTPVMKLCEEHRISHVTFYRWRRKAKAIDSAAPASNSAQASKSEVAVVQ